ncbi:MAG TPA: alpha/beta hydrolase-fold protein [Longimicrobium sp.]|nr:alpha/beta hydrolase-fold protein [Longimicrobium sp.]
MLATAACAPPRLAPAPSTGWVVADTVHSTTLADNPLGDSPHRAVSVYLPPDYGRSARRYPVVYLLHGFDGGPAQWTERFSLRTAMDSLIASGAVRPMIVVMPDGGNRFGGSFFANSAATGRWGTFLVRDVVAHVDARYRTLARASSRGVAGWSMGGHAALHRAAEHPEVFGAAYALSPCCLGAEILHDFGDAPRAAALALRTPAEVAAAPFGGKLLVALAALHSPDPSHPLGIALPFAPGRADALARWSEHNPARLARSYATARPRPHLAFDAGTRDGLRHIPPTARALHAALSEAGVAHTFEEYDGTHGSHVAQRMRTRVFPFFSRVLRR